MKTQDYIHEATGVVDVLGRQNNTKIVFKGDQAYTDGDTIYVPALPQGLDMNGKAVSIMRGYVDHESAHIRHTDWTVSKKLFKECEEKKRPLLKNLVNCVEDMFIERKQIELYSGSELNISTLCDTIHEKELDHIHEFTPESAACAAIYTLGRDKYAGKNTKALFEALPEKVKEHAREWQKWVDKVESTSDSIRVAKEIYKVLKEDPNLEESNPEDFQPDMDAPVDFSDLDDIEGEGKDQEGMSEAMAEAIEQMVEDAKKGTPEKGDTPSIGKPKGAKVTGYTVYTTEYDRVLHRKLPMVKDSSAFYEGDRADYIATKSRLKSKVTVMKSKLQRVLAAKEMRDWDFGREQGRLDTKRLVNAVNGQRNVYKRRKDREEMDTAVFLLVDLSGSMCGQKIKLARDTAVVLSECFEGTGIQYEIGGFTTNNPPGMYGIDRKGHYHRIDAVRHFIFKEFNEKLRDAQPALSTMTTLDMWNNADYDAIVWAQSRLKFRPESRKILVVLSDGHPANETWDVNWTSLERAAKEAVASCSEVEHIGIGIMDDAVKTIYPKHVVINNLEELTGSVLKELSKLLLEGKVEL